jgi:hypothetical protein
MSIIIALVSSRGGVVASDGRRFTSAFPDKGILAEIEQDNFDKTFSLFGGKVIGAFAGLLEFSGRTVREHISEIAPSRLDSSGDSEALANAIKHDLQEKLSIIRVEEVGRTYRRLDLLIVAGDRLSANNLKIFVIRFEPRNGIIVAEAPEIVCSSTHRIEQRFGGDPLAIAGAKEAMNVKRHEKINIGYLEGLVRRGIKGGIHSCGTHSFGTERTCGGGPFIRRLEKADWP